MKDHNEKWSAIDLLAGDFFIEDDPILDSVLQANDEAGLPRHNVSALQGQFLHIIAKAMRAEKILEIGTSGGYSAIWLARALPNNGQVITLENDSKSADLAHRNFELAGLNNIELREGKALHTLSHLKDEGAGPFDLIFIDADKPTYPEYFKWALDFSRPGTLIIIDNVVKEGEILNNDSPRPSVQGIQKMYEDIAAEFSAHKNIRATLQQTVSSKGHDGMIFILVESV